MRGSQPKVRLPQAEVSIPPYPSPGDEPIRMSPWMLFAPMAGMLVIGIGMAVMYGNLFYSIIIISSGLTYGVVNLFRQRERRKRYEEKAADVRDVYQRRIQQIEGQLKDLQEQQSAFLRKTYPPIKDIATWVEAPSECLWQRSPDGEDFMHLRLGKGTVPATYQIKYPQVAIPELEADELLQAIEMAQEYQQLEGAAIVRSLVKAGSLAITGPAHLRNSMAGSLLCQAAALHPPQDVEMFAVYPPSKVDEWAWLKWLPHTHALQVRGEQRNLAYEPDAVRDLCARLLDRLDRRRTQKESGRAPEGEAFLLFFVADTEQILGEAVLKRILEQGKGLSAGAILLAPNQQSLPEGVVLSLDMQNENVAVLEDRLAHVLVKVTPEPMQAQEAEAVARRLAPLELVEHGGMSELPHEIRLLDLIHVPDAAQVGLESRWEKALRSAPALKVPLGMRHGDRALIADLKQSGAGPHGLIAGTTGSGKSELLLTLLTGLAIEHHPHQVNFVLIDYKGGTAMSVLKDLPHTVGMVTDLDGKQTRRALVALGSEMERREALLTRYQVADIDKYHQLGHKEPFPYLFIVIDEFAELRERFRDDLSEVLREFVSVAQKGRALGVHLILAMQKPEGVVNDSIRANMKFRICLRVERLEDSRNVLGRPDAYLLPHRPPGRAYFQVGNNEQFDQFQVARIAGYQRFRDDKKKSLGFEIQEVGPDGSRIPTVQVREAPGREAEPGTALTEAQIIVREARQAAERMGLERLPSPWPPPLPETLPLDDLLARAGTPVWTQGIWPVNKTWIPVPVGTIDVPEEQGQDPLYLNPLEDGNMLVVGAPGSGRTTFLLSYAGALMRCMSPEWVHLHLIDYGGHRVRAALQGYPHVGGVYEASEHERLQRLMVHLEQELEARKGAFAACGAASLVGYRMQHLVAQPMPMLLVAINNFAGYFEAFRDDMMRFIRLLREGAGYGVFFLLLTDRMPISKISDLVATRLCLRLADRTWYSSILGARPDLRLYDPLPGRGFINTKPPHQVHLAKPAGESGEDEIRGLHQLGAAMRKAWDGAMPERVQVLGEKIPLADVLPMDVLDRWPIHADGCTWIGIEHSNLKPSAIHMSRLGGWFLVAGPPGCGRTQALGTIALALAATHAPERVQMGFLGVKRGADPLTPLAELPHTRWWAGAGGELDDVIADLEGEIENRTLDKGGESQAPPHLVLFVDDYPLLSSRLQSAQLNRVEAIGNRGAALGITFVISMPSGALSGVSDSVVRRLKLGRTGLWLGSTNYGDASAVGVTIPVHLRGKRFPPGRGFLHHPGGQILLQVASVPLEAGECDEGNAPLGLAGWVNAIRDAAGSDGR